MPVMKRIGQVREWSQTKRVLSQNLAFQVVAMCEYS